MPNLFLSYDRDDTARAQVVAKALEAVGHSVWWDRRIKGGGEFSKQIERALEQADAVVVLWSCHAVESAWVRDEAAAGRDKRKLVPATLDGTPPPLGFRQYQTVDLSTAPLRRGSRPIAALLEAIAAVVAGEQPDAATAPERPVTGVSRRLVAGGVLAATAAAGAGYFLLRPQAQQAPPEVQALLDQAWQSWTQGDAEGNNQAIGLYRKAIELAPTYADAWGLLACAYADRAHWWTSVDERPALRERSLEAGKRALQLDPKNAHGRAAIAWARPFRGNWLYMERETRKANGDQPGKYLIIYILGLLMSHVGRVTESAAFFGQLDGTTPHANQYYFHVSALWASGQLEEAERLIAQASAIYATHPSIWTVRYNMALTGGRPAAALALAQDRQARPSRVSDQWLERRAQVASTLAAQAPDQLSEVTAALMQDARESVGLAVRSLQDLSALGRLEEAFAVANAYFFSRGFVVPDLPVAVGETPQVTMESRFATFLFLPSTRAMRSDPRFERLMEELGLTRYWKASGSRPDYQRA